MKLHIENLDYPHLNSIPEYKAEFEKLARFRVELGNTEARHTRLQDELQAELARASQRTDAERIDEAERLLSGKHITALPDQIKQNIALAESLRRAIRSQEAVVDKLARSLSYKAAARFEEEHKKRVRRLVAALLELHAANQGEIALRRSIEELGYDSKLRAAVFDIPNAGIDPHDPFGGYVPAWYRDASEYVMTDQDRQETANRAASDGRRRKLASLT